MFGVAELGGTKTLVGFGDSDGSLDEVERIPTTSPGETLASVVDLLRRRTDLESVGIASFGPLELRHGHPTFGRVTNTTKAGWSGAPVLQPIREALGIPVGLDTDVNGAALGEGRWGAARGLDDFAYLTVGTGIGGGAVAAGRLVKGLSHPEMGHVVVQRRPDDDFAGVCPYHGDCLEGMASGPALEARFGPHRDDIAEDVADLAGFYLAQGVRAIVYLLSPQRVVVGGGVAKRPALIPAIQRHLEPQLSGYPGLDEHGPGFVVPAGLGETAGLAGAIVIAENAGA
jgi:fructokinase